MKLFSLLFIVLALSGVELRTANAAPVKRLFQDVKLPTQAILERQVFAIPLASSSNVILSNDAGPTSAALFAESTFTVQPDVPRNLEISPTGACSTHLNACSINVDGVNYNNHVINEAFAFALNTCTKQIGTKAFKSISKITWAAGCEASAFDVTWSVGVGEKLGLKRCMAHTGDIGWSTYNDNIEATKPTLTSSLASVELNTADFVGTMDGTKNFQLYFIQDYQCF